ncbi:hypothetical protein LCGC14_0336860 [marine sediment metagenome]|uniref:Uncharacterized protein n=1 Tax=marine sediment metagenome TaxID=412755 RepID=A0A0F9W2F1_9ZZZZ
MSDVKTQAIETRIDAALFGRRYWTTPGLRKAKRSSVNAMADLSVWQIEVTPASAANP